MPIHLASPALLGRDRRTARAYGALLAIVPALLIAGLIGLTTVSGVADGPASDLFADPAKAGGPDDATASAIGAAVDGTGSGGSDAGTGSTGTTALGADGQPLTGPGTTTAGQTTTSTGGGSSSTTRGVLRATDQGVTKDSITLGVLLADTGGLGKAGFNAGVSGDPKKIAEAWAQSVNRKGGINGRQVKLAYDSFDVLSVNDQLRACKKMTEDLKVFAVINLGGFDSIAQLCVAKDHKVPLIAGDPQPADWYTQAAPYLWTPLMTKDRLHIAMVRRLATDGFITKADKLGVLYHNIPNVAPPVERSLLPELARQGMSPVSTAKLAEDTAQALNQIPQAIVDMRAKGVTKVFLMTNLIFKTSFLQVADKQLFRPVAIDNDQYFGCYDFSTTSYPATYDGAACVTATNTGIPGEQTLDNPILNQTFVKSADAVYKAAFPAGYADGGGSSASGQLAQRALNLSYGADFLLWQEAAERAGTELTRARWGAEMGRTGRFDRTVTSPFFTFGPTKHDGPDQVAVLRWSADPVGPYGAKKWHQEGPFRPAGV